MIQKLTWLKLSDSSQAQWVNVFHLYSGFSRKVTSVGFFIKGSVRIIQPPFQIYKGFNLKFINKGKIVKVLITRQRYNKQLLYSISRISFLNTGVVLKRKGNILASHLIGPVMLEIRKKRFLQLFKASF